jgi:nucleoside-diphosphate-sugar epimerase
VRILVTGNLGYIGPLLVNRLIRDGHEVVGVDAGWFAADLIEPITAPSVQHHHDVRTLVADGEGRRSLAALLEGVDAVCHLAAVSNDPVADVSPEVTAEINFTASARLAEEVKAAGVRRLVFYSTCSVYGDAHGEVDESTPPRILTPYADSKVRLERHLMRLAGDRFWPVIFRDATVFGYSPGVRLDLIVNGMTAWAMTTGVVRLMSTGEALRPQLHVDDLVELTAHVLAEPDERFFHIAGRPINVGLNENNYAIRELAEIVAARIPGAHVRTDPDAWVDRRSYRVRFDLLARLLPEAPLRRLVPASIEELAAAYRRVGLTRHDVESGRLTRLGQLRRAQERGILDAQLRSARGGAAAVAPTPARR